MRPLPRRALLAATLGAVYAVLILPGPFLGVYPPAVAWFVLSAGLLFLHVWAYHAFTFWAMLWVVYRVIQHARAGDVVVALADLPLPVLSLYLLMSSGYREAAYAAREGEAPSPP